MTSDRQKLHDQLKQLVHSTTVLYLDDEKHNLNSFTANFRRRYEVITAQTEKEALELLKTNDVDVFLTDYKMPKINGNQMIEKVKCLYPSIKSMIITAYSDGIKSSVPILHKPFNIPEIVYNINYIS
jgi:response regulator RpfG family c-di-GMP phosphodiesterase